MLRVNMVCRYSKQANIAVNPTCHHFFLFPLLNDRASFRNGITKNSGKVFAAV
jgi:hypothetical protein